MEGKEEKKFYLHIDGQSIRVSQEVYRVYKSAEEKEKYFTKRLKKGRFRTEQEGQGMDYIPSREKSLEKLLEEGWEFAGSGESVEDAAVKACLEEELKEAVRSLPEEERVLVEGGRNLDIGIMNRESPRCLPMFLRGKICKAPHTSHSVFSR